MRFFLKINQGRDSLLLNAMQGDLTASGKCNTDLKEIVFELRSGWMSRKGNGYVHSVNIA